ncbi:hypothetical protein BGZ73_007988, partial [Actinomortierella ambigua]
MPSRGFCMAILTPLENGVLRRTPNGTYVLKEGDQLLPRNYAPEQLKAVSVDDTVTNEMYYEIEAVIGHRYDTDQARWLYLVKWKNYDDSYNLWIPKEHFRSLTTIQQYYKRLQMPAPAGIAPSASSAPSANNAPSAETTPSANNAPSVKRRTSANNKRSAPEASAAPEEDTP